MSEIQSNKGVDTTSSIRDLVLEAAIGVIELHGEAAVRVEDVAAKAGVKHPSVYHYFGNRDGLIVAAQTERYYRSLRNATTEFTELLKNAKTREEYIKIVDATVRSFSNQPAIVRRRIRREVLGSAVYRPELAENVKLLISDQVKDLVETFSRGIELGWITSPYGLDTVMFWWIGTIQGREFVDEISDERIVEEWDDLVARGVLSALFGTK
jgi:AcrR family transcriptional regulator